MSKEIDDTTAQYWYDTGYQAAEAHYQPLLEAEWKKGFDTGYVDCREAHSALLEAKDEEIRQLTARVEARDNEIERLKIAMGVPAYEADCEIKLLNEMLDAKDAELNRMAAVIEEMQPIEAMITLRDENTTLKALIEQARKHIKWVLAAPFVLDSLRRLRLEQTLTAINAATGEK